MGSQVNLQAVGLNYSPNNLALPEGSLSIAEDVIIRRDNVLESRRGFKEYSQEFGTSPDRSLQLISYKERILHHYNDSSLSKAILQYDTGTTVDGKAVFNNFTANVQPTEPGLRIKSIEANKNLYFTTEEGIKKISAASATDINANAIKEAGAVKAVGFTAELDITQGQQTGFLGFDSAVAYRVLWGYKDLNENLILGAPSDAVSVYNYLYKTSALDINALCLALDNLQQNSADYYSVIHNISTNANGDSFPESEGFSAKYYCPETITASEMRTNVINIAKSIDRFSALGNIADTYYAKPLKVSAVSVKDKEATISFQNENVTTYSNPAVTGINLPGGIDFRPNTDQLYIADSTSGLLRLDADGSIFSISTTPALFNPEDLVFDLSGNLYVCDTGNNQIVKLTFNGNAIATRTVIATSVLNPKAIAIDSLSNLYVCCGLSAPSLPRVIKITQSGIITEISNPDNEELRMLNPKGIDVDIDDNIYVSDADANVIKKLTDVTSRTATTTSASPTVTLTDTANLQVGMYVYGTNIPAGAKINAINASVSITLNTNATAGGSTTLSFSKNTSILSGTAPVVKTGTANNTTTTRLSNVTSLFVGMNVYGATVPLNTNITNIVNTVINLSGSSNGTTTLTVTNTTGLLPGMVVTSTNTTIPANTSIVNVLNLTQVQVSASVPANPTASFTFSDFRITTNNPIPTGSVNLSFTRKGNFQNGFNSPAYLKVNNQGLIFVSDTGNNVIKKIDSSGASDIVAGKNAISLTGSSAGGTTLTFANTAGLVAGMQVVGDGVLIPNNTTITTVNLDGTTIVVNNTIPAGASIDFSFISKGLINGKEDVARFDIPTGIAFSPDYDVFVAEVINKDIRKLSAESPETIFGIGDKIEILGGTSAIVNLNNKDEDNFRNYTITNVTKNYISFAANIGDISVTIPNSAFDIYSYEFRNILENRQVDITSSASRNLTPLNEYVVPENATNITYATIISTVYAINSKLKSLTTSVKTNYISQSLQDAYLLDLNVTQACNVKLVVNIPETIKTDKDYFFQVYRTQNFIALDGDVLGSTLTPDDEMRLVYEAFPTDQERIDLRVTFIDSYPADLRGFSTNLYTNPASGEGIGQANAIPPIAKDINFFKNVAFYANAKTRHRLVPFNLLGTSNINNGDTILITDGTSLQTREYTFVLGSVEKSEFTFNLSDLLRLKNRYFTLNSAKNEKRFYFWYRYNNSSIKIRTIIPGTLGTSISIADNENLNFINPTGTDINISSENNQLNGLKKISISSSDPSNPGHSFYGLRDKNNAVLILNGALSFSSISSGSVTTFQTVTDHGLVNGDGIYISNVNATPSTVLNKHHIVTVTGTNTFTVPVTTSAISSSPNARGFPSEELTLIPSATYVDENLEIQERIGVKIDLNNFNSVPSVEKVVEKTVNTINSKGLYFIATKINNDKFLVENLIEGITQNATLGTLTNLPNFPSDFSLSITSGDGEDISSGKILLSQTALRSQAIDLTARSIVSVINGDEDSPVYAYYASDSNTLPGIINLESKVQLDERFYVMGSTSGVGVSFNPDIGPINSPDQPSSAYITSIVSGGIGTGYSTITTNTNHGLQNGNIVILSNTGSANVNGIYTITNVTLNTFRINKEASISAGQGAAWSLRSETVVSTNEEKINRIYFSKLLQPEAVPLLNSIDVGSADRKILRIFPLRDSLFVFKEDGLFRISGETAPFVLGLFDTSCVLVAPDSVAVANNIVYCWTTKGISNVTEAGVTEISRPIDTEVLKLASSNYPNFSKLTWGVGYDSDNSYTVYTNTNPSDAYATKGFRYSNLTNTWTNFNRSQTCGIINPKDDKIYTGSGIKNVIDQERKSFDYTDYADREFAATVVSVSGKTIELTSVADIAVGDVVNQGGLEAVVLAVDTLNDTLTLNNIFAFTAGSITVFKAIPCKVQYSPVTFGDPLKLKQIYEATMMFNDKSFTTATASFSSDLVPNFYEIDFYGNGHNAVQTNAAPFRTIIPRNTQRCRYINVAFEHNIAREKWALYGITLTGNATESTRAYR